MKKCSDLVARGEMSQEYFDRILEATDVPALPEQAEKVYKPKGLIRGYRRERQEKK